MYKLTKIDVTPKAQPSIEVTFNEYVDIDTFLEHVKGFMQAAGYAISWDDYIQINTPEDRAEAEKSYTKRCDMEECAYCHSSEDEPVLVLKGKKSPTENAGESIEALAKSVSKDSCGNSGTLLCKCGNPMCFEGAV